MEFVHVPGHGLLVAKPTLVDRLFFIGVWPSSNVSPMSTVSWHGSSTFLHLSFYRSMLFNEHKTTFVVGSTFEAETLAADRLAADRLVADGLAAGRLRFVHNFVLIVASHVSFLFELETKKPKSQVLEKENTSD